MKNKPNYCLLTVLEDKVNQTTYLSLKVKQVVHFQAGGASGLLYVIRWGYLRVLIDVLCFI